jgi:ABC-type bacteriocin/lantibiotic exporter with double-glycine peptidase domain
MTAGLSHHAAWERAFAVYAEAEPDKARDRIPASHEVNVMIASATNVDPVWFWRPAQERMDRGEMRPRTVRQRFSFLMNLLHHLGTVGILLAGGWLVVQGRTEVGTVVAFISGLNRVNDPWGDLVNYFRDMTNARVKYGLIAAALGERASAEGSIKPERSRLGADFTA